MKSIVIYYSYGGNTRKIAKLIQETLGTDMEEIQTVQPYTGDYSDVVEQGQQEVNQGFMPEIKPLSVDLKEYDIVILGAPVWWYTFAPAMKTFLHSTDLTGKKVYPFATNGGWIGHTFKDFQNECIGSEVQSGLNVRFNGKKLLTAETDIRKWAKNIK